MLKLFNSRAFEPYSKYLRKKKPRRRWAKRHNLPVEDTVEDTPSHTPQEEEEKRNFR